MCNNHVYSMQRCLSRSYIVLIVLKILHTYRLKLICNFKSSFSSRKSYINSCGAVQFWQTYCSVEFQCPLYNKKVSVLDEPASFVHGGRSQHLHIAYLLARFYSKYISRYGTIYLFPRLLFNFCINSNAYLR